MQRLYIAALLLALSACGSQADKQEILKDVEQIVADEVDQLQSGVEPKQYVLAASQSLIGPSPAGLELSPYFWTWAKYGNYPIKTLQEGVTKVGLKSATIAFELSKGAGQCAVQGAFADMGDDMKAFRKAGHRLILSFGGATDDPPYVQKACKDGSKLAALIEKQIETYNAHALDFDIEGDDLGDMASNDNLIGALQMVQGKYSDLYLSFTLPVDADSGLPTTAVTLLKHCIAKKVKVSRVNLMTMDFGQMPKSGKTSADMVIGSVKAAMAQLTKLYPNENPAAVRHMVGITPLIGQNDPPSSGSFYFRPSDAKVVAAWAKKNGIGLLSFWGLMRDRAGSGSNDDFSNAQDKDFEFYNAFKAAQ